MDGEDLICSRCSRHLAPTAPAQAHLGWSDRGRVLAQGWLGSDGSAVCVGCLTYAETDFLHEPAAPRDGTGRFQRV
jgi:hypothetical protein